MEELKVGYVIFQHFRKLSRGRVSKQTCSQSAVRGMSIHDIEERALSEQPRDKKIDMVDKKQNKEENVCGTIRQEVGPV